MSGRIGAVARIARIVGYSAANAYADFRASYTWLSWGVGWLGRMLCQVAFFALTGRLVGGEDTVRYLVVGNAVLACVIESMTVVVSTAWERAQGTLPLLAAAPADIGWVMFGRSLQWPVSGTATASIALVTVAPLFGVHWSPSQLLVLLPLVALVSASTYCLGLSVGSVVLAVPGARNIIFNSSFLLLMAVCGAEVPVSFWPAPVQAIADLLPPTHGLAAVRALQAGSGAATVLTQALFTALTGMCWLVVALYAFRLSETRARRRHAYEFEV
ncbi:ABC transporter permease [Streptomyces sp. NPDC059629]|uniref:ABC transporter permease n=1 Tax=Streptomyces sp. NPDC059629 TaxID=3346889 RepID=UPI003691D2D9